jgi:HrpA-like RNA helicase
MTEGVLIRELIKDKRMKNCDFVIIDEAHERGINLDLLLGFMKFLSRQKVHPKIIIMSATLEVDKLTGFFSRLNKNFSKSQNKKKKKRQPKIPKIDQISVQGRFHPIEILNTTKSMRDYTESAKDIILQIHFNEPLQGDILVFLTGMEEIETLKEKLNEIIETNPKDFYNRPLEILPLYSLLSAEKQQKVFEKFANKRKVILSTNIAETSVTIDGVKFVVDCGFVKIKYFNNDDGVEALGVIPISKASAKQRAGRAGRNTPGKCIRLYTESAYEELDEFGIPEILRADLISLVLQLKGLGVNRVESFDFIDPPGEDILNDCLKTLVQLEALSKDNMTLLKKGKQLLEFPLDPFGGYCLMSLINVELSLAEDVISIVALMNGENIFSSQSLGSKSRKYLINKFGVSGSDHITQLKVLFGYIKAKNKKEFCNVFGINKRGIDNVILVRYQLLEIFERIKKSQASGNLYCKH